MVALKYGLPLIQNTQGVAVAFESEWLKAALDQAARKAGYEGWWLLDEFSTAVSQYLRQDYLRNTIELPSLEKVVRATLRDIGYDEIAVRFRAVNPFQCVSLVDCLQAVGTQKEAGFFKLLAARIESLHAAKVQHFQFNDLQPCVRRLLEEDVSSSWWGRPLMCTRIVAFVRERIQELSGQWKTQCTIR